MRNKLYVIGLILFCLQVANCFGQESTASDPCADAETTVEMQACFKTQYEAADAELNDSYKQLMSKLGQDRKTKFREAQRMWIQFRDASAAFEASEEEGGSMYSLLFVSAQTEMTRKRQAYLKDLLERLEN